jgi:hypothetical protein
LGVSNVPLNCCNHQRALKNILFTIQPHQLKILYSVVPPIIIPLENKWEIVLPWYPGSSSFPSDSLDQRSTEAKSARTAPGCCCMDSSSLDENKW